MNVYRQGDVLFMPIEKSEIPEKVKEKQTRLIRSGEYGGKHQLESNNKKDSKYGTIVEDEKNKTKYIITETGVGIVHGEHNRLDLPPGEYRVVVQREINKGQLRYVMD